MRKMAFNILVLSLFAMTFVPSNPLLAQDVQIEIYTDQPSYSTGDTIKVDLSLSNNGETSFYDVYIVLVKPDNEVYFFPGWIKMVTSLRVQLPKGFNLPRTTLFEFPIPNATPPIGEKGSYIFATGVTKPGQTYFLTGVKTASFQIQDGASVTCYTNGNRINSLFWHEGNLWAGTTGGLVVWDAMNESYVRITTADGIAGGDVREVIYDEYRGGYWVATNGGVSFFDGTSWTNYTSDDGLDTNDILSIAVDGDYSLWCGTNGYGVNVLENGRVTTRYNSSDYLPNDVILSICKDRANLMWIGTEDGAASFDGSNWTHYTKLINAGINGNIVRKIAVDKDNIKYFAVAEAYDQYGGNGVSAFDGQKWTYYWDTGEDGLLDNGVFDIFPDEGGNLWFATWLGLSGLQSSGYWSVNGWGYWTTSVSGGDDAIFYGTKFWGIGKLYMDAEYFITTTNEPVGNSISAFAIDKDNNIWIGTDMPLFGGDGVSRFDGKDFTNHDISIISNNVRDIAFDPNNDVVYVGTDDGLGYFKNNEWHKLTTADGLISNDITSLAVDLRGWLWIGTNEGISIYSQGYWFTLTAENGLPGNNITDIDVDSLGRVWIATTTGIKIYDDGSWITLYYNGNPFTGWTFSLSAGENGIGWGGLYENLIKIDLSREGDEVQYLGHNPRISELLKGSTINAIATAEDETVWLATDFNGLIGYTPQYVSQITTKDGLASNTINAILIDPSNRIWCGTTNGITVLTNP